MGFLGRALNRSLDIFFIGPFFDGGRARDLLGKAVCLCYHRVDKPENNAFLTETGYPAILPSELESDIRFLKKRGYEFITFADWRKRGALDPKRPHAILTFDDCFKDNYSNGLPALERAGARAVFFQVTSMIDSPELLWEQFVFWHCHDASRAAKFTEVAREALPEDPDVQRLSGLPLAFHVVEGLPFDKTQRIMKAARERLSSGKERGLAASIYPTRRDIEGAHKAGHEIGSHGHNHYKRVNVDAAEFERDLRVSIETVKTITGQTPLSYAYPHGNCKTGDSEICAKYFKHVATVDHGVIGPGTDPMALPRFYWSAPFKNELRRKRWLLTGKS